MKKKPLINMDLKPAIALLSFIVVILASCDILHPYHRPPGIAGNDLYRDTVINDSTNIATIPWKQFFADTFLQALIQEAINNNYDLKIASARIRESAANYRQSQLAFLPSVTANADASVSQNPNSKTATNGTGSGTGVVSNRGNQNYEVFLSSSWLVDIWGRLRSQRRAQLAALLQSEAYKRFVQTQMITSIVNDYYQLQAYDEQLKISLETVENRRQDVVTTEALKEADVLTGAAVMQSNANLYSVEVTLPDIRRNIRETENAICVLLGRNPGPIARDSLHTEHPPADLSIGLPIQLLSNRPDVQQAEFQLRYYTELTNVARTYFYPSIIITGQAGILQSSLSQFFNPVLFFSGLAGNLTQPIFQNGLNRQRLAVARGQEDEYLYTFERTLLTAGQEVSNYLYQFQTANEKVNIRTQQLYYLQKSVEFTRELMKYGYSNYTDVLTSEQSYLTAQLNSVNDKLQQMQAVVNLYTSLGGGVK